MVIQGEGADSRRKMITYRLRRHETAPAAPIAKRSAERKEEGKLQLFGSFDFTDKEHLFLQPSLENEFSMRSPGSFVRSYVSTALPNRERVSWE